MGIWERAFWQRDCQCKGPEVGVSLMCSRNGEKAVVAEQRWGRSSQRSRGSERL